MIDTILQAWILIAGVAYMLLYSFADRASLRRGHWIMLTVQPAWMVSNWQAGQWGMFALCLLYIAFGINGLRNTGGVEG